MFTIPSFASGIDANATSAPCDNATLETYGGTANVEINWEPNTIQTRWYDGNTLIDTTNTNADSCVYDDVLNVPPTPTNRTGYTFNGWTVRPEMDFAATIPTNVHGQEGWAKMNGNCSHYYTNPSETLIYEAECDSNFDELGQREWKTKYGHGTLYGMSGCSTVSGTYAQSGRPTIGSGQNCWCKVTGYKQVNSDVIFGSLFTLDWVFMSAKTSEELCLLDCPIRCAINAQWKPDFLTALFTPAN